MAVTETGRVAAVASVAFEPETLVPEQGGHEQPPEAWWRAVCQTTAAVIDQLSRQCQSVQQRLGAVAVDGTSGTLVAVSRVGEPLRPALMYNDPRSADEAAALNDAAGDFCDKLGYRFNASFALAKIAWLRRHEPAVFDAAARFVHQTDYVVERLTGQPAVSDYSNALKTGYDLIEDRWPAWIDRHLGIVSRLPSVVAPGSPIGAVSSKAAAETGLPEGLRVVAGASDGTAAFLASGARRVGDYNTTLGTTLVFKGISSRICRHPQGVIYCHKLPGGRWLPGAASNVGTDWIGAMFPGPICRRWTPRRPGGCRASVWRTRLVRSASGSRSWPPTPAGFSSPNCPTRPTVTPPVCRAWPWSNGLAIKCSMRAGDCTRF